MNESRWTICRDLAFRIVEVAEDAAFGRADAHARRLQLVLDAVCAEVALLGGPGVRIDEELIVRTGGHARAAADADRAVQIDDAVTAFEERVGRTDLEAGRFFALIAQDRKEQPLGVRERAFLDRLDPAAIDADRDVMFRLARNGARVAADAFLQIDNKPVVRHQRDYRRNRKAGKTGRFRYAPASFGYTEQREDWWDAQARAPPQRTRISRAPSPSRTSPR